MSDIQVPFSGEDGQHPISIQIGFNPQMGKWDLYVFAGNFEDEAAAKRFADRVAEFMAEEANAELLKAQ